MNNTILWFVLLITTNAISYAVNYTKPKALGVTISREVHENSADSLTIPQFFQTLTEDYADEFYSMDSTEYRAFCLANSLDIRSSENKHHYYSILILNELFTCQSASDCSKGNILNIPYQWHWVEPNPRYQIFFTGTNLRLKDSKPPKGLSKYQSFADIDRTPYLYLSDLAAPDLKYYSSNCDTFSTFGWCSEREMAFTALTTLLGYDSKVVTEDNHSWTEIRVSLKLTDGEFNDFRVVVDNTFHQLQWTPLPQQSIAQWRRYFGNTPRSSWYDKQAKAETELSRISQHRMALQSMRRIEDAVTRYVRIKMTKD